MKMALETIISKRAIRLLLLASAWVPLPLISEVAHVLREWKWIRETISFLHHLA
jgi:hypothetical protein